MRDLPQPRENHLSEQTVPQIGWSTNESVHNVVNETCQRYVMSLGFSTLLRVILTCSFLNILTWGVLKLAQCHVADEVVQVRRTL